MKPEKRAERDKQKTKDFTIKSEEKFPDKFDYTNTKYTGGKNKVSMRCIKHNEIFLITSYNHLHQ